MLSIWLVGAKLCWLVEAAVQRPPSARSCRKQTCALDPPVAERAPEMQSFYFVGANEFGTVYLLQKTGSGYVIIPIHQHVTRLSDAFGGAVAVSCEGHVKLMQCSFEKGEAQSIIRIKADSSSSSDSDMAKSGTLYGVHGSSASDAISKFARVMATPVSA